MPLFIADVKADVNTQDLDAVMITDHTEICANIYYACFTMAGRSCRQDQLSLACMCYTDVAANPLARTVCVCLRMCFLRM